MLPKATYQRLISMSGSKVQEYQVNEVEAK